MKRLVAGESGVTRTGSRNLYYGDRIAKRIYYLESWGGQRLGVRSTRRQVKVLKLAAGSEIGDVVERLHSWVSHHDIALELTRRSRVTLDGDGVDSEARDNVCSGGSLGGEWTGRDKHDRCCCDPG